MQKPASRPRPFARTVRRGGKAIRQYLPPGPLADYMNAELELERLEREAARQAEIAFQKPFEPVQTATILCVRAVLKLYFRLMRSCGYHFVHQTWRKRRISAAEYFRREGVTVIADEELQKVSDLGRTAREAWFELAAGGDPQVRRALGVELESLRARWSCQSDPPALEPMVDLLALAWLQSHYLDIRYAHALKHELPQSQLAFLARLADTARQRVAQVQCDLEDGRTRLVQREIERAKLEELHREARRRKRKSSQSSQNPFAKPRKKSSSKMPYTDPL